MTDQILTLDQKKALELLQKDADKIVQLIEMQLENLTMPQCPLYEEVLDTQMFGLSREISFAVRLGLIDQETGKKIMSGVEMKLEKMHQYFENK